MTTILAFLQTTTAQNYLANQDQKNLQNGMNAEDREREQRVNKEWMTSCQNSIQLFEKSKPGTTFSNKKDEELPRSLQLNGVESQMNAERIAHISSRPWNSESVTKQKFLLNLYEEIRMFGL